MDPTKSTLLTSPRTIDELRAEATLLHRIEWRNTEGSVVATGDSTYRLRCNVVPSGHVAPHDDSDIATAPASHL